MVTLAAALVGCSLPPPTPTPASRGQFASSEVKPAPTPHDRARVALALPAASGRRRALRAAYDDGPAGAARKRTLLGAVPRLDAGARTTMANAVAVVAVTLRAGQRVVVETRDITAGGDTVVHLLSRRSGAEVAFDDDSGDQRGASRLTHNAGASGTYLVIVRAYHRDDAGRCDVYVNGVRRLRAARFGGSGTRVPAGYRVHAVLINDGPGGASARDRGFNASDRASTDPLLLLVHAESGRLLAIDDDSGVELGARLDAGAEPAIAIVAAVDERAEGRVRVVVNDVTSRDADGDGLGDLAEQALCLCARKSGSVCGFDCSKVVSPQDTDGDGLSDADEVLGHDHARFPQLLPRWGADPRHKDLFVEIDLASYVDKLAGLVTRHFGRTLSQSDSHAAADVFTRLSQMRNPDGKDGLALHLDTNQRCGDGALGIDGVCGPLCAYGRDGKRACGQTIWTGAPTPRADSLDPARRHLFKVAVSDCLIAGRASISPSDNVEFDCDRFSAMVHELGHTFALWHYGWPNWGTGNCKPNYPSIMNYAFSDGYASTRALRFSDGSLLGDAGDLDPRDLDETKPFGKPGVDVSYLADRPFYYTLDCSGGDGCRVDWNRDGRFDKSVRAYLSPMPNYGGICENKHGNTQEVGDVDDLDVVGGVALAVLDRDSGGGGKRTATVHLFAPARGKDKAIGLYLATRAAGAEKWSKPTLLAGPQTLRADTQPAALTMPGLGEIWLFATVDGDEPVRVARLGRDGKLSSWETVPGQPAGLRARDVSVTAHGTDLVLVVRDERASAGDRVLATRYTPSGWDKAFTVVTVEGRRPLRSRVTPGVAAAADGRLYLAAGDPDPPPGSGPPGRLHLYSAAAGSFELRDDELAGVRFADGRPTQEHVLWARPAMVFVAHRDGKGQPLSDGRGYLAIWWTRVTSMRYVTTWGRLDENGADFEIGRWHHYEAYGYIRMLRDASPALVVHDTHLGAALAQGSGKPYRVRWVPYANGVPKDELLSRDYDDRSSIRDNLCKSLNNGCFERCQRLTDTCKADKDRAATAAQRSAAREHDVQCVLPRWRPE